MMNVNLVLQAVLTGVGGTIILDLWALFLARVFQVPATSWPMVGRWIGNMRHGIFMHENIAAAAPVPGETAIGWIAHYAIGASYGLLLIAIAGQSWIVRPTLLPPLLLAWALLVAPYFLLMPGMGAGIAGAKTPDPMATRLKSAIGHTIFGLGMYVTAVALAVDWSCLPARAACTNTYLAGLERAPFAIPGLMM